MTPTTRMLAHVVRTPGAQSRIAAYMAPDTSAALLEVSRCRRVFVLAQRAHCRATEAHKAAFRGDNPALIRDTWTDVRESELAMAFASRALTDALAAAGIDRVELF